MSVARPHVRSRLQLYVDVLLLAVLLLLFSPRLAGLPVHEWLGIALVGAVLVHLLLSWRWISASTQRFAVRSDWRGRVNYVLNCLLFVLIFIAITSGVVISAVALPAFGVRTINDRSWRALHNLTLNWTLLVIGLHVAMNWQPIVAGFGRHIRPGPLVRE